MGKITKISKSMNITAREKLVINATEGVEFESSNQIQLNAGEQILYQSSDDIEFQPPHTTRVYLGVFFDGTGNNKYNVEARKKGEISMEKAKDGDYASYFANYSNIARLWNLYKKDYISNDKTKHTYYTRAYIEGIGTKRGMPDDMIGSGMGRLERGILGKVSDAYQEVINSFNDRDYPIPKKYKKNHLGKTVPHIDELVIDIFGFSRGAAAARHFANIVNTAFEPEREERYWSISQKDFAYRKIKRQPPGGSFGKALEKAGFPLGDTVIKIRFIGLFDTVAAVTSDTEIAPTIIGAMDGFSIGNIPGAIIGGIIGTRNLPKAAQNCDNGNIRLSLANVHAEIAHITASDEYRANFILNKVTKGYEMRMCGVHSDIGGGYGEITEENNYILSLPVRTSDKTPPEELEKLKKKFEESSFYKEDQIWIETIKYKEELDRSPRNLDSLNPRMSITYQHTLKGSRGKITDRYSLIPMEIMKEYAKEKGVTWMSPAEAENKDMNNIPQTDYMIDEFLKEKILPIYEDHYLKSKKQIFENEVYKKLYNKYLHISSEYNNPMGFIYPNQPDETGKRKICK
jgi:hypothetical protein